MEEVPLKEGRKIEECMVLGLFLTNYAVFVLLCVLCVGPRVRVAEEACSSCWVNVYSCAMSTIVQTTTTRPLLILSSLLKTCQPQIFKHGCNSFVTVPSVQ